MAKAKTRRMGGRKAVTPKRASNPAKAKKSKKTAKTRAKSVVKPRRAARKAATRQASARRSRSSARAKANRRTVAKRSARKAVARGSSATRPAPRKVATAAPGRKAAAAVKKAAGAAKKAARRVKSVATVVVVRKTLASARPTPAPIERKAPVAPPTPAPPRVRRKAAAIHVKPPALERQRRHLPEADVVPSPPSSLNLDRTASAARSGQAELAEHLAEHTETGPEITAGDIDANWESAYSTGDEAPGGDNPTPDQDVVDDIGKSLGVVYEDAEELKGADKITERDKHRWELDPASAEDYKER